MRFCLSAASMIFFFSSCMDTTSKTDNKSKPLPITGEFAQSHNQSSDCLEKTLNFLNEKPSSIRAVVIEVGRAAKICNSTESELMAYAQQLVLKYGDDI